MARYGKSFKNKAVARVLAPHSEALEVVARDVGIGSATLERWRDEVLALPAGERGGSALTSTSASAAATRFDGVLTTATMDEASKSAWCRAHGIYPQQLADWRQSCTQSLAERGSARAKQVLPQALQARQDRTRIKELERELHRKERALAECAALLVLSKKVAAIFSKGEDE